MEIPPVQYSLRVQSIAFGADEVLVFDLRPAKGMELPSFDPGAHIDLHLPGGVVRSYSLLNDPRERHRYLIAIKRDAASRGGSKWMHESARVGTEVEVCGPKNHFALVENAPHSVLVAGGIGITPLFCMAQRLQAIGRSWELHYRCRRRDSAALMEELARPGFRERVSLSFSEDHGTPRLDMASVVAAAPQGTHFYCCGPNAMIETFEQACDAIPAECVHTEHFGAIEAPATDGGYTVRLARSGRVLPVAAGNTILSTLAAHGVKTRSSCEQGVCGECEVRVLAGTPDHRDLVLTSEERASCRTMMICCSGSLTPELTLDL